MKKYHIILVVFLSIFFMPDTAMACGSSNSKHTCEKEAKSTKTEKKGFLSLVKHLSMLAFSPIKSGSPQSHNTDISPRPR